MSKTYDRAVPKDTYLALIRRFPLKPIKDDREYEAAVAVLQDLMGRKLDSGQADYYETLLLLVNKYEQEAHAIGEAMTPAEAMDALMKANDMTQAELAAIIGTTQSGVSMMVAGDRAPSKAQVKRLVERFHVDPMLFL